MSNKRIKGEQLYVFLSASNVFLPIGASTDCSLRFNASLVEVASKNGGAWRRFRVSKKGWEISCAGFYFDQPSVPNSMVEGANMIGTACRIAISVLAKELVEAGVNIGNLTPNEDAALVGDAVISSCEYSGSKGSLATYSITLQGSGPLEPIK